MTILLNDPTASDHLDAAWPVCRVGVGPDTSRVGLVVDYRGDQPPLRLLLALREHGWATPTPVPPPAGAIDWSRPDPVAGRPWSLRPYVVRGALAVPGPGTSRQGASVDWLEHALERLGLRLGAEFVPVASLRDARAGVAELVDVGRDGDGAAPVDPFAQAAAAPAPAAVSTPPPASPAPAVVSTQPSAPAGPAVGSAPPPPPGADARPEVEAVEAVAVAVETVAVAAVAVEGVTVGAAVPEVERPLAAPLSWVPPDPATLCAVTVVARAGALQAVGEVLDRWDLAGDAVFQPVSGTGRGGGRVVRFRGQKRTEPLARLAVTVAVAVSDAEALADALAAAARHGEQGDGKVWVV